MPSTAWPATIASNALPPFSKIRSAARVASAFIAAAFASDSPSCPIVTPASEQINIPTSTIRFNDRMRPPQIFAKTNSQRCFDHVGDVEKIFRIDRRAKSHLDWPWQSSNYQQRSAFMRNYFATTLNLQSQSAGL